MREEEMKQVANWMKQVSDEISHFDYKDTKEERIETIKEFRKFIENNEKLKEIRKDIKTLCEKFPIYK